jgi:hypothetical protein
MFASKAGVYLSGAPLWNRLLVLLTNISLGRKHLPGRKTPAYYEQS